MTAIRRLSFGLAFWTLLVAIAPAANALAQTQVDLAPYQYKSTANPYFDIEVLRGLLTETQLESKQSASLLLQLSQLHRLVGDDESALEALENARNHDPTSTDVGYATVDLLSTSTDDTVFDSKRALQTLNAIESNDKRHATFKAIRTKAFLSNGMFDSALLELKDAVADSATTESDLQGLKTLANRKQRCVTTFERELGDMCSILANECRQKKQVRRLLLCYVHFRGAREFFANALLMACAPISDAGNLERSARPLLFGADDAGNVTSQLLSELNTATADDRRMFRLGFAWKIPDVALDVVIGAPESNELKALLNNQSFCSAIGPEAGTNVAQHCSGVDQVRVLSLVAFERESTVQSVLSQYSASVYHNPLNYDRDADKVFRKAAAKACAYLTVLDILEVKTSPTQNTRTKSLGSAFLGNNPNAFDEMVLSCHSNVVECSQFYDHDDSDRFRRELEALLAATKSYQAEYQKLSQVRLDNASRLALQHAQTEIIARGQKELNDYLQQLLRGN